MLETGLIGAFAVCLRYMVSKYVETEHIQIYVLEISSTGNDNIEMSVMDQV